MTVPASRGGFGTKWDDAGKALSTEPGTGCALSKCSFTKAAVSRAACPVELSGMRVMLSDRPARHELQVAAEHGEHGHCD